jgi:hypothetical protein
LAEVEYAGNLQIVLEYAERDSMKIRVDKGADTKAIIDALTERSSEIKECIADKTGIVSVEASDSFIMSSAGGKVRNVVDLRK